MSTETLVDYLSSLGLRRLPTEQVHLELDYARRERALAENSDYEAYQSKRVKALTREIDRRKCLKKVIENSRLTPDFLRDLKQRVDIRDIFNDILGILCRPSGPKRETYICPAHSDVHPSGILYLDDQHYHCFQCQAHGDVFDCLMAFKGMTFLQAVDTVAEYLGVELPK